MGAHSVGGDGGDGGAGRNEGGRSAGVGYGYSCQQDHDVVKAHGDEDQHPVEGDEIGGESHHFAGVGTEEPLECSAGNRDGYQRGDPSERNHPASGVGAVAVLVFQQQADLDGHGHEGEAERAYAHAEGVEGLDFLEALEGG